MSGYYFLCANEVIFDKEAVFMFIADIEEMKNIAKQWAKEHSYKKVYVYTILHVFKCKYEFKKL